MMSIPTANGAQSTGGLNATGLTKVNKTGKSYKPELKGVLSGTSCYASEPCYVAGSVDVELTMKLHGYGMSSC